jgi:hypothetical protein
VDTFLHSTICYFSNLLFCQKKILFSCSISVHVLLFPKAKDNKTKDEKEKAKLSPTALKALKKRGHIGNAHSHGRATNEPGLGHFAPETIVIAFEFGMAGAFKSLP